PIGLAGGINPFVYANNNPLNWIDPNGLAGISFDFGGDFSSEFLGLGGQAGSGFYIGAKDWYAELGAYTYTSKMEDPGPTKINAAASLGLNVNIYTVDADKFFPGKMKYHKWTPGIFAFGYYTDLEGSFTGLFFSIGPGFGVTADECGTATGTQHVLQ
ncbi:MAG: hypothetical protein KKF12_14005, partial [Proteobacteria bacterium]|nr:hypothetical protein [Pseudomonadota bacterium]